MIVLTTDKPMTWGELDVPLIGATKDWFGHPLTPAAGYALVADPLRLWFIATHPQPARIHPAARPGKFTPELWKYDVAELFLHHTPTGRYFEFNLSPNGAWWSCEFTAPRVRAEQVDIVFPEVATFADIDAEGRWVAAMAIPRDLLVARLDFGPETHANVTFILNSPDQQFITVADLGHGEPDFHQPARFPRIDLRPKP